MSRDDVVALLLSGPPEIAGENHAPVERDEERQARERIAAALQALPSDPSPLFTLWRQLDEARAEFAKTGDPGVAWRIGELVQFIRTTPPGSLSDCLVKLWVAVEHRDPLAFPSAEDLISLQQVDEYFARGD